MISSSFSVHCSGYYLVAYGNTYVGKWVGMFWRNLPATMERETHTSIPNMEGTGVTWQEEAYALQYFSYPRFFFGY
jgi:hypothetical protein